MPGKGEDMGESPAVLFALSIPIRLLPQPMTEVVELKETDRFAS